ncbi:MAG: hypothetical protein U1E74_07540 [Paenacidovorax caeni]
MIDFLERVVATLSALTPAKRGVGVRPNEKTRHKPGSSHVRRSLRLAAGGEGPLGLRVERGLHGRLVPPWPLAWRRLSLPGLFSWRYWPCGYLWAVCFAVPLLQLQAQLSAGAAFCGGYGRFFRGRNRCLLGGSGSSRLLAVWLLPLSWRLGAAFFVATVLAGAAAFLAGAAAFLTGAAAFLAGAAALVAGAAFFAATVFLAGASVAVAFLAGAAFLAAGFFAVAMMVSWVDGHGALHAEPVRSDPWRWIRTSNAMNEASPWVRQRASRQRARGIFAIAVQVISPRKVRRQTGTR